MSKKKNKNGFSVSALPRFPLFLLYLDQLLASFEAWDGHVLSQSRILSAKNRALDLHGRLLCRIQYLHLCWPLQLYMRLNHHNSLSSHFHRNHSDVHFGQGGMKRGRFDS